MRASRRTLAAMWHPVACAVALVCVVDFAGAHVLRDLPTQNVKGLAKSHPPQTSPGTIGLPNGCNTYAERYGSYANFTELKGHGWDPNAETPDANEVVLVRFHVGGRLPWDLLLHFRALMAEAAHAGKHIYFLHEDRPAAQKAGGTPHKLRAGMPPELRPAAFAYSPDALAALYPAATPGQQGYLPFAFFMHTFPAYRFAWCLEHDLRYTGMSWGDLLNGALHQASLAVQQRGAGSPPSGRRRRRLANTVVQRWEDGKEKERQEEERDEQFRELFVNTGDRGKSRKSENGTEPAAPFVGIVNGTAQAGGRANASEPVEVAGADEAETLRSFSEDQKRGDVSPPKEGRVEPRQKEAEQAHQAWRGWEPYRPEHEEALRREAADGGLTVGQMVALAKKQREAAGGARAPSRNETRRSNSNGTAGMPDLLLFGTSLRALGDKEPQEKEHWRLPRLHRAEVPAMGLSRLMAEALHAHANAGNGGVAEEFVPSLAIEAGLNVVTVPVSQWGGDSYSCCSDAAKVYYKGWKEAAECRHFALLHPVRIKRADADLYEGPSS